MLCNWSQKESDKTRRILTVMASFVGKKLYLCLRHELVSSVTAWVDGETEVDIDILIKEPNDTTPAKATVLQLA